MYKIEKSIPKPTKRQPKYPFADMEVGDSFFVGETGAAIQSRLSSSAAYRGKKGQGVFTVQKDVTDGIDGYRIWRTE